MLRKRYIRQKNNTQRKHYFFCPANYLYETYVERGSHMTNAGKAAFLNLYRTYELEADRTKKELQIWRERAEETALTGECAERIRYFTQLLQTKYRACLASRLLAEDVINQAPTPRDRLLLRLHYVDGLSLEAVAEQMDLSTRQIMRLHKAVMDVLEVPQVRGGVEQAAFEEALTRLAA